MTGTTIGRVASWVSSLRFEDIPPRVIEKAKAQLMSVLAAVYAGSLLEESRSVADASGRWGQGKEASVLATGQKRSIEAAVCANTAMSMALDYDDYLFMGHSGHSAVLVPLAVCEAEDLRFREMLLAQVAANEVAGRLGASALLGPLNGQMFSFIHLLASSCSAARLHGLDPSRMGHAMAVALSHPCFPLEPGFFAAGSKYLTAALPCLIGLRAVGLARAGLTGPLGVLDHPRGFYRVFSYYPVRGVWGGLGRQWVTDTVSIKIHPGCAYISAALDAMAEIFDRVRLSRGRPPEPNEVASVTVRTSLVGIEMEEHSRAYRDGERLHPVAIGFSLRYSLALMLLAGRLDPESLTESYLAGHAGELRSLAAKVSVIPDHELNRLLVRAMIEQGGFGAVLAGLSPRELLYLSVQAARNYHFGSWFGRAEAAPADRASRGVRVPGSAPALVAGALSALRYALAAYRRAKGRPYDLEEQDLERFSFPFAARVSLELADGSRFEAGQMIPRGAAGSEECTREALAEEKFAREARRVLTPVQIEKAISFIKTAADSATVRTLIPLVARKRAASGSRS